MNIEQEGSVVELSLNDCFNLEGWDRTFDYNGYTYAVLSKSGDSAHTRVHCTGGMFPCVNLKSLTVRAIGRNELVRPLKCRVKRQLLLALPSR